METQTEQINKALNDGFKSITERWNKEDRLNKEIRKTKKGLFLLYEGKYKIICPYYSIEYIRELKKFSYGSRLYKERRPLTEEEHKQYFKLLDKLKRINKQIDKFKGCLKC